MHELSLCQQIYKVVAQAAQGREVQTVHLQVGRLRQVVPETLTYCWTLVVQDGPLADSRLQIESIPITLACRACHELTEVEHDLVLVCARCASGDIEVRTGEEFLITSMDVGEARTTAPAPP
ncbi:MAG: hydrogenase maturation nickel metallochaperone HypA [Nostocoides sp.]